jgi:hypothetical protein
MRQAVARKLKDDPSQSDRAIAGESHIDHKTVGTVRRKLESTGEIPQLNTTRGGDGKKRSRRHSGAKKEVHPDPTPSQSSLPSAPKEEQDSKIASSRRRSCWLRLTHHSATLQMFSTELMRLSKVPVAGQNPKDVRRVVDRIRTLADTIEREVCEDDEE